MPAVVCVSPPPASSRGVTKQHEQDKLMQMKFSYVTGTILIAIVSSATARGLRSSKSSGKSSKSSASSGSSSSSDDGIKNVIIMVPDGCDEAVQTLARWYKGTDLQLDKLPRSSVKIHMANSVITDSAAAATAFASGKKTTAHFVGVGPRTQDLLSIYEPSEMAEPYAPIATVLEAAKSIGKSTGLVVTSRVSHATPAAFASHIDNRGKENDIMEHLVYNNIDVVFGGGKRHLLPGPDCHNAVEGGVRTDCQNLMRVLEERGVQIYDSEYDLSKLESGKAWGMFAMDQLSPDVDRQYFAPSEPSLKEMTEKAIELLSQNSEGFLLLVEGSQVDMAAHSNDPFYMLTEFIAFDDAVKVAVDFAKDNSDTLVLVFPDHNTGGMEIGNYLHGYENVTVEALRDPFVRMNMTSLGLAKYLPKDPTDQDIVNVTATYWGINLSESDVAAIHEYMNSTGTDLRNAWNRVVSERHTLVGWTTHGHNGEIVPVWVYGSPAPQYVIENTDLAVMVAEILNVDLDELTEKLFVDLDTTQIEYVVNLDNKTNPMIEAGGAIIPIGKDFMVIDGQRISLSGVTVYAPMTSKVYLSSEAVDRLSKNRDIL